MYAGIRLMLYEPPHMKTCSLSIQTTKRSSSILLLAVWIVENLLILHPNLNTFTSRSMF